MRLSVCIVRLAVALMLEGARRTVVTAAWESPFADWHEVSGITGANSTARQTSRTNLMRAA